MWDQLQPFLLPVEFAEAAKVTCSGEQEIDWPVELIGPVFPAGYRSLLRIDEND